MVQASDEKQAAEGIGGKEETPTLQKGLDAIASSLSLLGDTLGTAIEVCVEFLTLKIDQSHSGHFTPWPRAVTIKL